MRERATSALDSILMIEKVGRREVFAFERENRYRTRLLKLVCRICRSQREFRREAMELNRGLARKLPGHLPYLFHSGDRRSPHAVHPVP